MVGPIKEDKELFEEILRDITIFKPILTKEVNEYLESLLNLEISALSKNNISETNEEALKHLELYRKLVYYNILLKSKKLVDTTSDKYALNDAFDSFFIDLNNGDCQHKDKLFLLGRNHEYESFVELYKTENISFEEYMNIQENYRKDMIKQVEDEDYAKSLIGNCDEFKRMRLNFAIKEMDAKNDSDWKKEYDYSMFVAREQRSYLSLFLQDTKLTEEDFITNEDNNLVREGKVYRLTIER